jgi:hypothetical protein
VISRGLWFSVTGSFFVLTTLEGKSRDAFVLFGNEAADSQALNSLHLFFAIENAGENTLYKIAHTSSILTASTRVLDSSSEILKHSNVTRIATTACDLIWQHMPVSTEDRTLIRNIDCLSMN